MTITASAQLPTLAEAAAERADRALLGLRIAVLAAVETALAAVVVETAIPVSQGLVAGLLLPVAYAAGHRWRAHGAPTAAKLGSIVVATALMLSVVGSAGELESLDQFRYPLAEMLVWLQILQALDSPAARNLMVALGSSLTLMAVAGSLSQGMTYGLFLIGYGLAAIAALSMAHRADVLGGVGLVGGTGPKGWRPALGMGRSFGLAVLAGAVLFLVLPQPAGGSSLVLPFRIGSGGGTATGGILRAPAGSPDSGGRSTGGRYYGVADHMDLRVRGTLPTQVVMRVRASAPARWRGALFDKYDGTSWEGDTGRARSLGGGPRYDYPFTTPPGPRRTVTQTFYVESEQPNAVFAAGIPERLFFEGGVGIDQLGGLRTQSTLTEGSVYSVISSVGVASAEELRQAHGGGPRGGPGRYLAIPEVVPQRVRDLATSVTAGLTNNYDRAKAVETYLRNTYLYQLDSPVPPEGHDNVDHFLFEARVGFCEQFASAMVVMLRSLGVPSRMVTGYVPGDRNPFTGYHTVRGDDAHAWVDVWFPHYGWYEFDPTSSVAAPRSGLLGTVPLVRLARWLANRGDVAIPVASGLLTILLGGLVLTLRRGRGPARRAFAGPAYQPGPIGAAFARLDALLAPIGQGRRPSETPAEVLRRLRLSDSARTGLDQEAYGLRPPDDDLTARAAAEIDQAAQRLLARPT